MSSREHAHSIGPSIEMPVILKKEVPGHIANRLSSALYREAVYLVEQGSRETSKISMRRSPKDLGCAGPSWGRI